MEFEECLETDGATDEGEGACCKINETLNPSTNHCMEMSKKLPNGFGYTPDTRKFRTNIHHSKKEKTNADPNMGEDSDPESTLEKVVIAFSNEFGSQNSDCMKKDQSDEASTPMKQNGNNTDSSDSEDALSLEAEMLEAFDDTTCNIDIETDTIYAQKQRQRILEQAPPETPSDYIDMCPENLPMESKVTFLCWIPLEKKRPAKKSSIRIPYQKADTPDWDEFGALLCTVKERRTHDKIYYRHLLLVEDPNGPAGQMKIETNDELVLLNGDFAPDLSHKKVIDLFKAVQVDDKTRLYLVIRRVQEEKWEWVETSAILCHDPDEHAHVENLEYREVHTNWIEVREEKYFYEATGTQKFLNISDGRVCIDVMKHDDTDKSKIIWRRAKYRMDKHGYIDFFAAALCDETETWYIGIDEQKQIVLSREAVWFKMIHVGSKVRFQFKEVYLGYERESGEVKAEVAQCVFEECPVENVLKTAENILESSPGQEEIENGASQDNRIGSRVSPISHCTEGDSNLPSETNSENGSNSSLHNNRDSDMRSTVSDLSESSGYRSECVEEKNVSKLTKVKSEKQKNGTLSKSVGTSAQLVSC